MECVNDMVALLLEDNNTPVIVYGKGMPVEGKHTTLEDVLSVWRPHLRVLYGKNIPDTDILNELVRRGLSFAVQRRPGSFHVVSGKLPLGVGSKARNLAKQTFNLKPEQVIAWSHYFGGGAHMKRFSDVYAVDKEDEIAQKEEAKERERINKEREKAGQPPLPEESVLTDTESEFLKYSPEGHSSVYFGFSYHKNTNNGVHVAAIAPKSPAALAGLKAGDAITGVGPFYGTNGSYVGKKKVQTPQDFWNLVHKMQPGVPVPIEVMRGDVLAPANHIVPQPGGSA